MSIKNAEHSCPLLGGDIPHSGMSIKNAEHSCHVLFGFAVGREERRPFTKLPVMVQSPYMSFSVRAAALLLLFSPLLASGPGAFCQAAPDFEVSGHVLVKYHGRALELVIPENLGINRIGERAFAGTMIRAVKVPVGVDAIDSQAFAGCAFLKSVFLPNTLTVIGYRAFFNCGLLETINIPRSLRAIEGGAFFNCRSLRALDLPASLRSIGARAFSGCAGMETLAVPRRTKLGEHAFMGIPPDRIHYKD